MKYQHDKEIEMNIDFLSYFDGFCLERGYVPYQNYVDK